MALLRRRKLALIALAIYWPILFVLTHIPMPRAIGAAHVSDVGLHFLAYLILASLLWPAFWPYRRIDWRKAPVWWALAILLLYGIADEILQHFVGRNCDARDLAADMLGVASAFVLLWSLTFWPTVLVITGVAVVSLAEVTRDLTASFPKTNAVFQFLAYAVFTGLWIRYLQIRSFPRPPALKWLVLALAGPLLLLLAAVLYSLLRYWNFAARDFILSIAGTALVLAIVYAACLWRKGAPKPRR